MPTYSFKETLLVFSENLKTYPPDADVENGEVELAVDTMHVIISKGKQEGSLKLQTTLGLIIQPINEERLKELATSNFLGINTGGCKLAFDEKGVAISLHASTSSGTSPQENWQWLHRLLCVASEWNKILAQWDEIIPLAASHKEK